MINLPKKPTLERAVPPHTPRLGCRPDSLDIFFIDFLQGGPPPCTPAGLPRGARPGYPLGLVPRPPA